jgi:hypothetical protein
MLPIARLVVKSPHIISLFSLALRWGLGYNLRDSDETPWKRMRTPDFASPAGEAAR